MNHALGQIEETAVGVVRGLLATSSKSDVHFKRTFRLDERIDNEVLVIGQVHPAYNDGYCIAILNPRQALAELLQPAVAYSSVILKGLVAGHCDAMVQVQILANGSIVGSSYQARDR